jgi:hypothetical protein
MEVLVCVGLRFGGDVEWQQFIPLLKVNLKSGEEESEKG